MTDSNQILCNTCEETKSRLAMDTATRCIECADSAQEKNEKDKPKIRINHTDMMAVWATKEMR